MSSVTTYLATDQRAGINTGTPISVTEIYHENSFIKSSIHISSQRHQSLVFLSSSMVSKRLLSMLKILKYSSGANNSIDRSTHKEPVKVRHGTSRVQVQFKIYVNCGPGDNPAQSDVCGHISGNGNHPCRKCFVGRPQQVKETDIGFHSLFEVGNHLFSLLVFTRLRYPGWCCSFHWRDPLGCQVPSQTGLSGYCPECTESADQEWYQRWLYPILDWWPYSSCLNIAQEPPWTDYSWYPDRTADLGAREQKWYL